MDFQLDFISGDGKITNVMFLAAGGRLTFDPQGELQNDDQGRSRLRGQLLEVARALVAHLEADEVSHAKP